MNSPTSLLVAVVGIRSICHVSCGNNYHRKLRGGGGRQKYADLTPSRCTSYEDLEEMVKVVQPECSFLKIS